MLYDHNIQHLRTRTMGFHDTSATLLQGVCSEEGKQVLSRYVQTIKYVTPVQCLPWSHEKLNKWGTLFHYQKSKHDIGEEDCQYR